MVPTAGARELVAVSAMLREVVKLAVVARMPPPIESVLAAAPRLASAEICRVPAVIVTGEPLKVLAPERIRVPGLALVRVPVPEMTPPTVSGAEPNTAKVRAPASETAPVPRLMAWVPPNCRPRVPLMAVEKAMVGFEATVMAASERLSKRVPAANSRVVAPPMAPALFRKSVPSRWVTVPVKVLAFQRLSVRVGLTLVRLVPESLAVTTLSATVPLS